MPTVDEYLESVGGKKPQKAQSGGMSPEDYIASVSGKKPPKAAAATKKPKSLAGQAGELVTALPRGVLGLGKDIATEGVGIVRTAFANPFDDKKPYAMRQKGETKEQHARRVNPASAGVVQSGKRTAKKVSEGAVSLAPGGLKPSQTTYGKASREGRILAEVVEDVANIATLGRAGGAIAGKGASVAAARGATGTARVLGGAEKVATARPVRLGVAKAAGAAKSAGDRLARSETTAGGIIRRLELDPDSRLLRREAIEPGQERVSAGTGDIVRRGETVARILPDLDEQRAMTLVAEGEADALAKARASLPPERFSRYVARTYGDSVPEAAVHMAADVAEGKAPDLAARITEAIDVGADARRVAAERYYESGIPGRAEQAGFEPLPLVVEKKLSPILKAAQRAENVAAGARARADRAVGSAGGRAEAAQARALADQEARAVAAADRLTSARDLAEARALAEAPTAVSDAAVRSVGAAGARADEASRRAARLFDEEDPRFLGARATAESRGDTLAGRLLGVAERGSRSARPVARRAGAAAERASQAERALRAETRRLAQVAEGKGVLPAPVSEATGKARLLENLARSAEVRAASIGGHLEHARRNAEHSLEAAPSRLRPVLQRNREVQQLLTYEENQLRKAGLNDEAARVGQVADEIATTLERLREQGVDFDYFAHVKLDAKPTTAGVVSGALPRLRKGRESKHRKGSSVYDRTVRAQAQAEVDALKIATAREAIEKIKTLPFVQRFPSVEEATKDGYVAWDPASPFEKSATITRNTIFVPEHIHRGFRSYYVDGQIDDILTKTWDRGTQAFKVTVLPLSPSWQVGNVLGNVLLATFAAGVNPAVLAKNIGVALREYRRSGPRGQRSFEAVGPRRLFTSGPTHEERGFLNPASVANPAQGVARRAGRKALGAGGAVVRKSYALNEFVDNVGRSAVFLSKKGAGMTDEAALKEALKAMGDFSRMTPFERKVVRRIIPFYAWQRHLTQLAFRLPVEHPLRTAWTLHIADQWGYDEELAQLPSYMQGAIRLPGGRLLSTSALNPFTNVGGPVLHPEDLPRSLHPGLKLLAEQAPGSPARGVSTLSGRPFTRPPGTAALDELGRELPTAPSIRKQIADISPQKRLLESVLSDRDQVARYESGDPILVGGEPIATPEKTAIRALLKSLGLGVSDLDEALEIAERTRERQVEAAEAEERYRRRLARARGGS